LARQQEDGPDRNTSGSFKVSQLSQLTLFSPEIVWERLEESRGSHWNENWSPDKVACLEILPENRKRNKWRYLRLKPRPR
jgi:hypothetical protein